MKSMKLALAVCAFWALACGDAPADTAPIGGGQCKQASSCCKVCEDSKACGDSCIAKGNDCNAGAGCACDAYEVCN